MPDPPRSTWQRVARRTRVPLGFGFAAFYLWVARPAAGSIALGAAIAACGLTLRAAASGHVRKNAVLTTSGPYRYVRHPLYAGSIIIAAGFAVAARSPWVVLVMTVLFVAIYWPVILAEEQYLRAHFAGYDVFARRVPRLLPRLRPAAGEPGTFSRALYLRHREYNALLGAIALFAALAAKLYWMHTG